MQPSTLVCLNCHHYYYYYYYYCSYILHDMCHPNNEQITQPYQSVSEFVFNNWPPACLWLEPRDHIFVRISTFNVGCYDDLFWHSYKNKVQNKGSSSIEIILWHRSSQKCPSQRICFQIFKACTMNGKQWKVSYGTVLFTWLLHPKTIMYHHHHHHLLSSTTTSGICACKSMGRTAASQPH